MKVFIAGGRGRVGSPLADNLEVKGIEVVSGGLEDGIDVISGKGLAEALVGVDTIVNVLNTPASMRRGPSRSSRERSAT